MMARKEAVVLTAVVPCPLTTNVVVLGGWRSGMTMDLVKELGLVSLAARVWLDTRSSLGVVVWLAWYISVNEPGVALQAQYKLISIFQGPDVSSRGDFQ